MNRIFLLLLLMPMIILGQKPVNPKAKTITKSKVTIKPTAVAIDGFVINGEVKGYADGTTVALINPNTGATEVSTTIKNEKFSLNGKVATPDFKILSFNQQQPYVTLFLDNSVIKVKGTKDVLANLTITGSKSNADFQAFNTLLQPYQNVFAENAVNDSVSIANAIKVTSEFAIQHPASFVSPLAIYRFNQLNEDISKTELLFNQLIPEVKASLIGNYLSQIIAEAKNNGIGTVMSDFTQTDTSGVPVSLSSLRGKYVLIDFWASWCGPCRRENPNVVEAFNKYKNKNFTVLGVSLDKGKPEWIEAIKADGLNWIHVSDLKYWSNAVAQQFQIQSIPQNFLIDPQGRIVGKNLRGASLEMKLEKILR